ncbi:MAG: YraN family protein [Clostridium sp.]|uniref:YraN family protein n=1 Tax=Clostridium sp. TaxID=1506 RepID=UPI003F3F8715
MKKLNKTIGNYGEDLAEKFLLSKGFKILKRNFRNRFGEIDFICQKDSTISFVEVKTRYSNTFGFPLESVTSKKRKNIIYLSKYYILENNVTDFFLRFDILEIYLNHNNDNIKFNFLENAFQL